MNSIDSNGDSKLFDVNNRNNRHIQQHNNRNKWYNCIINTRQNVINFIASSFKVFN